MYIRICLFTVALDKGSQISTQKNFDDMGSKSMRGSTHIGLIDDYCEFVCAMYKTYLWDVFTVAKNYSAVRPVIPGFVRSTE